MVPVRLPKLRDNRTFNLFRTAKPPTNGNHVKHPPNKAFKSNPIVFWKQ